MFERTPIRLLASAAAAAACAVALLLGSASPSPGAGTGRVHLVRPGETLWTIAVRAYPSEDPREAVDEIARANAMETSTIRSGERIVLP